MTTYKILPLLRSPRASGFMLITVDAKGRETPTIIYETEADAQAGLPALQQRDLEAA